MSGVWQDIRYGLRGFRSVPGFAAVVILMLAIGIGANTAIFSAFNALLLRPLPIRDVDRVIFGIALREGCDPFGSSFLDYRLYRDEARTLASTGLGTPRQFMLLRDGEPERLHGAAVTASYLTTLGIRPAIGRLFTAEEDRAGGPAVALLSHELWVRLYAAEPAIVGRTIVLDGAPYTIVGALPPGFDAPYSAAVWVPMQVAIDSLPIDQLASTGHELVARLRPGVSLAQAEAELKKLAARIADEYPQFRRGWSYGIVPLRRQLLADLDGRMERLLVALAIGVGFLLLICCANVASLMLARGISRERELAIRRSLGASTSRLIRQLFTESLLFAACGGVVGVLFAVWGIPVLGALSPVQAAGLGPWLTDFRIDVRVLQFSLAITLLTGLLFGLVPALKGSREDDLSSAIKRAEHRAGTTREGRRSLSTLVVAEIAIAATLLAASAMVVRSFQRLQGIDLGFRPEGLVTMELPLPEAKYPTVRSRARLMDEVLLRVRALPGVLAAGMTTNIPLQRGVTLDSIFEVEGRPKASPSETPITARRLVSPGYPEAIGLTLVKGRLLEPGDSEGRLPVAVVSEQLVRESWPGEEPLGKRVRRMRAGQPGPWMTVVGVVKDVKEDRFNFRVARPVWYVPFAQDPFPPANFPLNLVIRTAGNWQELVPAVRAAIRSVDPALPVAGIMPLQEQIADLLVGPRFGAVLLGGLSAIGLLLAALELYGVIAYTVGRRRGEIGLRMALGATSIDILRLIGAQGAALVGAGLLLGTVGAFALTRLLASTLYGATAGDPATVATAFSVLLVTAVVACLLPARQAMRIAPMAALQAE
jgi:putative ABC transport system permease protein